jgi:hypothetical protein
MITKTYLGETIDTRTVAREFVADQDPGVYAVGIGPSLERSSFGPTTLDHAQRIARRWRTARAEATAAPFIAAHVIVVR